MCHSTLNSEYFCGSTGIGYPANLQMSNRQMTNLRLTILRRVIVEKILLFWHKLLSILENLLFFEM